MHPPALQTSDFYGPLLGALGFVLAMSFVKEPTRQRLNAVAVAGASGVYMSGGLGLWELAYAMIAGTVGYFALRSYRWLGIGWLMHACWDIVHHLYGQPIWPFMPTSSFGCMLFDSAIALWFLAGAPSLAGRSFATKPHPEEDVTCASTRNAR